MKFLVSLGPGLVTAAIVFGPSKITITSKMGALFGYSLLWVVVLAIFFMIVFTNMASRIGIASNQSLLATIRQKYGAWASGLIGFGIFLVATSFQAGNSIGVGISIAEASGSSPVPWIVLFNVVGLVLLFFRNFYRTLERLMIVIVALMLIAFVTTMFLIGPDIQQIVIGMRLSVPDSSVGLMIAFVASCFSIVGAFYQTYLVQARKRLSPDMSLDKSKGVIGMIVLGIMAAVVMICAAAVLRPLGIGVNKASDMALALEPLFGSYASHLFLVGLFGASFSSLIGNATVGGSLLSDAFGYGNNLDSNVVKALIGLVIVAGASIAIGYERPPLELIVLAQSITVILVPFIGVAMYAIACDGSLMGQYVAPPIIRIMGIIGIAMLMVLAVYNFNELFLMSN